ncbi:membrane-associated progesterone-binding protein 4-like [Primulina huaijiensis]|uniref:membrane-associated progesterone-binding protein 4-like n=1 Tax=Primulina huaijiensis TaxID=1492673 RepID=UPI003CC78787
MRWSPFLGIPILFAIISSIVSKLFPTSSTYFPPVRLFTVEYLASYNGTDPGLPILLGILRSVFDVTKGRDPYGAGGGYNQFSGRDASRAFVSGNFTGEGLTDTLHGLACTEVIYALLWLSHSRFFSLHVVIMMYDYLHALCL